MNGKRIAILATNGFEQAELEVPRDRLKKAGATVDIVSLERLLSCSQYRANFTGAIDDQPG
jgi:putative intracellular protease/amidase